MNTVVALFDGGNTSKTEALWQYDYGQILILTGVDLPGVFEVHFTNSLYGETLLGLGENSQVAIPDELLLEGKEIYAFIYLHTGADDGETEYKITIPVRSRPQPSGDTPTPVEQDIITQAIATLNYAIEQTSGDVESANDARDAAQSAQSAGETAQAKAEDAWAKAETARDGAIEAKDRAVTAETNAGRSATDAASSSTDAYGYATDAAESADKAEQSASKAGYMFFYINEDGHLIYQRTSNTQVDFYLENGHLYVEASA